MLCLCGFELYSRWVPLTAVYLFVASSVSVAGDTCFKI